MKGILLAIQFFTVFPVKKELPLGKKEVTAMFGALPFVGGTIGLAMFAISELMQNVFEVEAFLTAVVIVLTGILLTGGLHLDGWADTGDAFFSYKDREKRLEILEDPRLGAFGTMVLILLVLLKVALFHELITRGLGMWELFIVVPFLTRIAMNVYFSTLRSAKNKGIAYFLKDKLQSNHVIVWAIASGLAILIGLGYRIESIAVPSFLALFLVMGVYLFRKWSAKHFGGVSGDLSGAFIEGMEVVLWTAALLLL